MIDWFRLPACVIHCFTGTKEHAAKYLELGCYIGLTGTVIYRVNHKQDNLNGDLS